MSKPALQLSKFLSFLLRHGADEFGLVLDDQGFAEMDAVWCCVEDRYGKRFTQDDLDLVLAGDKDGKKRFERKDGLIRAFYGHSKVKAIVYEDATPPAILYPATCITEPPPKHGKRSNRPAFYRCSANMYI